MEKGLESLVCCDDEQVAAIYRQMNIPISLLQRCPSCLYNFAQVFFAMSCSPNQADFVEVTEYGEKDSVRAFNYYLSKEYAQNTFNSCASVKYPSSNGYVVDELMCSRKGNSKCTPQLLFDSLGDPGNAVLNITFILDQTKDSYTPLMLESVACSQKAPSISEYACSCMDCPYVCVPPKPFPNDPDNTEFKFDQVALAATLSYVAILVATVVCFVWFHYFLKKESVLDDVTNEVNFSRIDETFSESSNTLCQQSIGKIFGYYGKLCSRSPYSIIFPVLGLIISISLSTGLVNYDPVTDPIKLWSDPTSTGRIEKDIFDNKFGPFYRAQNIIASPINMNFINITVNGNETVFGPAFEQKFLLELLELQQKIMSITIDSTLNTTMNATSLCYSPLNNNICLVQSPFGWFNNDASLLSRPGYLKHIQYCINNKMSFADEAFFNTPCVAPYGGPIFPNIALGDFSNKNYLLAKSAVFTLTLNNHVDEKDNENAEKWEAKFLDLLKSHNSSTMKLAFYSEVCV